MKRSQINSALKEMEGMCKKHFCFLPPFCDFTPEDWKRKGHDYDEVRDCMLGWDVTDYGVGKFDELGFALVTIRNGNRLMADRYPKVYAEKLLYLKEKQYFAQPLSLVQNGGYHQQGGGNVLIRVYNSLADESVDRKSDVTVHTDGRAYVVPAGTQIRLTPGESIHVYQHLYHDLRRSRAPGRFVGRGQPMQR
jgi:D-lyxose ketol-isomerase